MQRRIPGFKYLDMDVYPFSQMWFGVESIWLPNIEEPTNAIKNFDNVIPQWYQLTYAILQAPPDPRSSAKSAAIGFDSWHSREFAANPAIRSLYNSS